jgi:Uma2 family endonuclease
MALAAPTVPRDRPADCLAQVLRQEHLRFTADQFAAVCQANPDAALELDASGQVIRMTPTGSESGARNTRLLARLQAWADRSGDWLVFDSSSGFRLPVGSVLSPDASLLLHQRHQANGAQLGWLPIPEEQAVEVWPASGGGDPLRIEAATHLDAGELFAGLTIELQEIWQV